MSALADAQERLWRFITAPSGVRAALAEAGPAERDAFETLLARDDALPSALRLEIYANAYFQRILEVLERDFEALAAALGEAGFHDLVTAYLCVHPPRRASLRHAGAELPGFLAAHEAAAPFRSRWPFAADLVRFEWAKGIAFDAPDAEPLGREHLARVAPERWDGLCFALQPGAALLEFGWDVTEAAPVLRPTRVRVWRKRERVHHRKIEDEEFALLADLVAGASFGDLCARLVAVAGEEEAPQRAAGWLAHWLEDELLAARP